MRLMFGVDRISDGLKLRFEVIGAVPDIKLPPAGRRERRDELWKQTCFEAFLTSDDFSGYLEFNFAPNGDWAAYQFESYRDGGSNLTMDAPDIQTDRASDRLAVTATIARLPKDLLSGQIRLGPAAILQTHQGDRSYWALAHPAARPDFHRPENFKINLD